MILEHLDLLGSLLELEKYEELGEELGKNLRAFLGSFLVVFGRGEEEERRVRCVIYMVMLGKSNDDKNPIKCNILGMEGEVFVGRKSREGEGDGEADGMGGRSEGDGVLTLI